LKSFHGTPPGKDLAPEFFTEDQLSHITGNTRQLYTSQILNSTFFKFFLPQPPRAKQLATFRKAQCQKGGSVLHLLIMGFSAQEAEDPTKVQSHPWQLGWLPEGWEARRGGSWVQHLVKEGAMSPGEHDPAEIRLVEEFLAGKPEALNELQRRLLQRAPNAIHRARKRKSVKGLVPEDLAAVVLSDLYTNKEKLQAFQSWTKGLDHFLGNLLWSAAMHQAQEEKRRRKKQEPLSEIHVPDGSLPYLPSEILEELRRRLTPKENEYLEWYEKFLQEGAPPCPFPDTYAKRLEDRIVTKARMLAYGQ
jgi:hypothetical protein